MKKIICLSLLLMVFMPNVIMAVAVEIDGIYYNIDTSTQTASVTRYNYLESYSGNVVIPFTFDYNGSTYKVVSIGDDAFNGCYSVTSVSIPNSVTLIGERAFEGCYGLTSLIIPEGVIRISDFEFSGCSGITSISLPESLRSIGQNVFSNCTGITSINLPSNLTSIPRAAFYGCI